MSHKKHKLIAPRVPTAPLGTGATKTSGRLPDELMSEHVQRLAVFSAVAACLWTVALLMDTVVTPLTLPTEVSRERIAIELFAIIGCGLVFLYVRYADCAPEKKADAGLGFMLLNAFGIALINTWLKTPSLTALGYVSWNTIVILVSSMILATSPRKMLATSLVAASMDPLGVWIAHLRGLPTASLGATIVLFWANYACAAVAVLPAHLLHHMGRRLREAQELGSYQLVELLGRGGMGEVWRANHRLLARSAAIKLVRPELLGANNETAARLMLRRFEREAQATAALSSPNTIRVFDFGVTSEGTFYYVMELLSGRDLDSLVKEFGPVPADRAIHLLRQVCHSLADAHARGLVHRDIKPANIYVCRMGLEYDFIKVLDFGLVKFNDRRSGQTMMTADHTTTGTPAFMAPEIILGGDVDRRADVYALGCVAYYLLTGQQVFEGDTPMKLFLQHLNTVPVPPSERTELPIPPELERLVLACLEKDPNKRPQDAEQLLRLARQCQAGECWDNDTARRWWEMHLVELTGPLMLSEPTSDVVDRAVAAF
ncbi:MAG: serine/threonine-protein kinase [Acidobacteriota bacterium]